jgi:hypothetical protein
MKNTVQKNIVNPTITQSLIELLSSVPPQTPAYPISAGACDSPPVRLYRLPPCRLAHWFFIRAELPTLWSSVLQVTCISAHPLTNPLNQLTSRLRRIISSRDRESNPTITICSSNN